VFLKKLYNSEKNMTLIEHLEELRVRLIVSVLCVFGGIVLGTFLAKPVAHWLIRPFEKIEIKRDEKLLRFRVGKDGGLLCMNMVSSDGVSSHTLLGDGASSKTIFSDVSSQRMAFYLPDTPAENPPDFIWGNTLQKPIFLNPLDPVTIWFRTAAILGIVIALPFLLWQLWCFVAPGLTKKERKTVIPLLALGSILFPCGALFAYYMFGMVLNFLVNFQFMNMEPQLEVMRYFGLELRIMIGFGLVFEFPLVIMFLVFLGILHPTQLRKYRPHAIVGIAIASMVLSPGPDVSLMLLMLAPLIILYEMSIWLSIPLARKRAAEEAAEDKAEDEPEVET
jgi:sec-independent protein translocase protein TatC